MSEFKVGDFVYILVGDVSSFGERAYKAVIISIEDGWKCNLMCLTDEGESIGESFLGVLNSLYKTKNEAIEEMIKRLEELRE